MSNNGAVKRGVVISNNGIVKDIIESECQAENDHVKCVPLNKNIRPFNETKKSITSIPWNQLYGMRNRIVHGYEGVNMQIVWDTVKEDIPDLCAEIKKLI